MHLLKMLLYYNKYEDVRQVSYSMNYIVLNNAMSFQISCNLDLVNNTVLAYGIQSSERWLYGSQSPFKTIHLTFT